MTKPPMTVGSTYADVVVWRWDRSRMRWGTELPDGTVLEAVHDRANKRSFWQARIDGAVVDGRAYENADQAQEAALAAWRSRRPTPAEE